MSWAWVAPSHWIVQSPNCLLMLFMVSSWAAILAEDSSTALAAAATWTRAARPAWVLVVRDLLGRDLRVEGAPRGSPAVPVVVATGGGVARVGATRAPTHAGARVVGCVLTHLRQK